MLDIRWIRENPERLAKAYDNRNWLPDSEPLAALDGPSQQQIASSPEPGLKRRFFIAGLVALDEARRANILKLEAAQARRNSASRDIGKAKAAKDEAAASALMAEVAALKDQLPALEEEGRQIDARLKTALSWLPNVPADDVPVGADEHANAKYFRAGTSEAERPRQRSYGFAPKEHFEIGEALGEMDFAAAARMSGARFTVLKKGLARLSRALGQFMLDLHTEEHGYTEVNPPLLVKDDALFGTAQLPKFEDDLFHTLKPISIQDYIFRFAGIHFREQFLPFSQEASRRMESEGWSAQQVNDWSASIDWDSKIEASKRRAAEDPYERFWLIPTSEVSLANLVREQITAEEELPLRVTALTPCFRSEAGASGRDTRGMLRQHQFEKVELISVTTPEQSRDEHERMLACAEEVLKRLDLHYRVMLLSTGDMGFASQKTYDIEAWLPGQGAYREISSVSVCGDFQARRMEARYKGKDGKVKGLVHTLNGSGVAVGRALIAVIETYQNGNGSVTIPTALRPYMGGLERIGDAE